MKKTTKTTTEISNDLKGMLDLDIDSDEVNENLDVVEHNPFTDAPVSNPKLEEELLSWSEEKMDYIFGECWKEIISYAKENNITVKNLIAITGKDTRKTTVWIIFKWWLMNRYPYLNGFLLRDTIVKAKSQMRMQLIKAASLIDKEYGITGFEKFIYDGSEGLFLVRDKISKTNQKVELLSFDSIVELGGFTTNNGGPAIFIYDELQNPNSKNKDIISKDQFIANYKFIADKNEGIEISTNQILPSYIPRHYFLSNRYIDNHPLNLFAEEHLPFYDYEDANGNLVKGVKSWMLEDPLNNNFICMFITKENVRKGWEDLADTCLVYASKFSNMILRANKEWEQKQINLIARGREEDLAVIIGDLFEGYESERPTYFYTRKEKISQENFTYKVAPFVEKVFLCMDLDFSRQIVMSAKYITNENGSTKIYRDKIVVIKCDGVSPDGAKTEAYLSRTYNEVIKYCVRIKNLIPKTNKVSILMDDKKAQWVGRFNQGVYANNFYTASKITFDQTWPIAERPKDIDFLQDTGSIVDIEHPSLDALHRYMSGSFSEPVSSKSGKITYKRIEKANDGTIDFINQDEYPMYFIKSKVRTEHYRKTGK